MMIAILGIFPTVDPTVVTSFLVLSVLAFLFYIQSGTSLPLVNGKERLEFRLSPAKKRFLVDAKSLIARGLKKPFKEGTNPDNIVQDAVRMKLTQSLGDVTKPLSDETAVTLRSHWTDNTEWHTINTKETVLQIVAQLSSKVFLGDRICRDPRWLRITVDYTVDSFLAAQSLRMWPTIFHPVVARFLPSCRKVQSELQEAREIINPVLAERAAEKEAAARQGSTPKRYTDAMEWMEQCAKGRPYDAGAAQLSFSLAAIHTTSDMLTQVLYDLSGKDELIEALREEARTVIKEDGWQKTTLYKLKLMDSMLKESQRMKPISVVSMRRLATKTVTLSDGTTIPKGTSIFVSSKRMWDPEIYPNPGTFDAYRFLRLRETPGNENSSQLVSVSPEHFGFGLGKHACPGRFFAANEIKIALCHILLKYDFRLEEGSQPEIMKMGSEISADHFARLQIRRRESEIEL
ncbi:cytochrome P450 [Aspergillus steynii IBT 23096]|uniref:Cytochrome P450 n=1 Tax=Aspergillus steynii IBT 23096 TaxID=1392250 RepID=A0A2I2GA07_9EURO|nr:cytochrome P450 [Aspergillus steynii IBT 23096]PLB49717.1 cytochrome P450 [Aspergillus steynii IBT 23096]